MNRILAIIVAVVVPLAGVVIGALSPEQAFRTAALCVFPILLIFKPPFIRSYFKSGPTPVIVGWLAFGAIFVQAFLFPIWFVWMRQAAP
jgi:hypothetical protein